MNDTIALQYWLLAAAHEDRIRDADTRHHVRAARRRRPATKRAGSAITTWLVNLAAAVSVLLVPLAHAQQETLHSTSSVYRFTDFGAVDGATSTLLHGSDFVAVTLTTEGLAPDAPYTLWWVVFNDPDACTGDACDLDDLFNPDGTMNLNEAADISILFADGTITDGAGRAAFSGVLYVDRPLGEVVLGPGLRDALTAEIHVVVRAHGPLDPSRAFAQLTTFEPHTVIGGDCLACFDEQVAIHAPAATLRAAR